ncbi:hypothetical protein EUX98_g6861 [Antrodiella citrinella]|uniref:Tf2-1-like SH3-like domain-containing protein n=1 Tax=Antrodiella citrinella TaxID=2447956 RepID=A0A4S4MN45_9APHY|nr:hypothetical protein EUX98_g6861 [Antrodiella citrinella]
MFCLRARSGRTFIDSLELSSACRVHIIPNQMDPRRRANRTITQMLRQSINTDQRDWVAKLPAIEFAINLARSDSTGYAPFFLNTGRMPRSLIWNNPGLDEYPAVRTYAQRVKYAVMAAHDSIIAARVKQTRDANRRRRPVPFVANDLVYVSSKNMSLPKGLARKFIPEYIGPYKITQDFGNNSFRLDLPPYLKRRGIHDIFHSSVLRAHGPNDDRLFPGRLDSQVAEIADQDEEWAIERIVGHNGSGENAIFETIWKTGDRTWVPYHTVAHVGALAAYLEAVGVEQIGDLTEGTGTPPTDDPQIFIGQLEIALPHSEHWEYKVSASVDGSEPQDSPFDLSHSLIIIPNLATMAETGHAFFCRYLDGTGAVISEITDDGEPEYYHYTSSRLREYSGFDSILRTGTFNPVKTAVPSGYPEFAVRFNRDDDCRYGFSTFDRDSMKTRIVRAHLDADVLAPLPPGLAQAARDSELEALRGIAVRDMIRKSTRAEQGKNQRLARKNVVVTPPHAALDDIRRQRKKRTDKRPAHPAATNGVAAGIPIPPQNDTVAAVLGPVAGPSFNHDIAEFLATGTGASTPAGEFIAQNFAVPAIAAGDEDQEMSDKGADGEQLEGYDELVAGGP